ncbi:unknown [Anaerotruncus sp. CAG:390]|nr:unknown [Anaerotruncus sp. CAG:390]
MPRDAILPLATRAIRSIDHTARDTSAAAARQSLTVPLKYQPIAAAVRAAMPAYAIGRPFKSSTAPLSFPLSLPVRIIQFIRRNVKDMSEFIRRILHKMITHAYILFHKRAV